MDPKAFVVYGHDKDAYDELSKFLRAVGVTEITFEDVAAQLPHPAFVADIVFAGIEQARVIIVLLTPDELSVLYDSRTGAFQGGAPEGARWQARPNVIFEAGVALGARRGNTILATLGADVMLFSDVSGLYTLRLDAETGKRKLFNWLRRHFPELKEPGDQWEMSASSGDFIRCRRGRWEPYDEQHRLQQALASEKVSNRLTALQVVRDTVLRNPRINWRQESPEELCKAMERRYPSDVVDITYWSLFLHGFVQPKGHTQYYSGDGTKWRQGVQYAKFAERGLLLIDRWRNAV